MPRRNRNKKKPSFFDGLTTPSPYFVSYMDKVRSAAQRECAQDAYRRFCASRPIQDPGMSQLISTPRGPGIDWNHFMRLP